MSIDEEDLDTQLRYRGYTYLAHPSVPHEDKLCVINQKDGFEGILHAAEARSSAGASSLGRQLLQVGLNSYTSEPHCPGPSFEDDEVMDCESAENIGLSKRKRLPSPPRNSGQKMLRQPSPNRKKRQAMDLDDNHKGSHGSGFNWSSGGSSSGGSSSGGSSSGGSSSGGSSSGGSSRDESSRDESSRDESSSESEVDEYFKGPAQHAGAGFSSDPDFYCSLQPDGPDKPRLVLVRDHAMASSHGLLAAFTTNAQTRFKTIQDFMKKANADDNPGYIDIGNKLHEIQNDRTLRGGDEDSDNIESFLHEMLNEERPAGVQSRIEQNVLQYGAPWHTMEMHHDQDCSVHATKIRNEKWSTASDWSSQKAREALGQAWSNDLNAIVDCKFATDEPVMKKLLHSLWTELGQRKLVSKWYKSYRGSTISRAGANQYNYIPGGVISHNNAIERDNGLTKAECRRTLFLVAKAPLQTCELVTLKTRKAKHLTWHKFFSRDVVSLKANLKAYKLMTKLELKKEASPLDVCFEYKGSWIIPTYSTLKEIFHKEQLTGAAFPRNDIGRIKKEFTKGRLGRRLRMYKQMQDGDGEGVAEALSRYHFSETTTRASKGFENSNFQEYVAIQNAFVTLTYISHEGYTQLMCKKLVNASFQLGIDAEAIVEKAKEKKAFVASNCKTFYMRGLSEYTVAMAFRGGLLTRWPSRRSPIRLASRSKRTKSHAGEALQTRDTLLIAKRRGKKGN